MTYSDEFTTLGDESFVSLTTFRKSGEPVSTPVWIARDGDALIVTTPEESGKVKRLRNNARVEITPSTRMGKTKEGATPVPAFARIHKDAASVEKLGATFSKKYRLEYRIFMIIEAIVAKRQKPRVMLRITPTE